MQYLQKTWVRILLSLFVGGMITEIIHISNGDPNRERASGESTLTLLFAVAAFFIITALVKNRKY